VSNDFVARFCDELIIKQIVNFVLEGLACFTKAKTEEEEQNSTQWHKGAKNLPANVVAAVGTVNISLSRQTEKPPNSPREEVLNGEAPPEHKDGNPPLLLATC